MQKILAPYLLNHNVFLNPIGLDGGFNYDRLKFNIIKLLNGDQDAYVTTLVDLYGLKGDYPGQAINRTRAAFDKAQNMEYAMELDILSSKPIHNTKFIPYFQLHEFEALLFSDPSILEESLSLDRPLKRGCFNKISAQFNSPEHINDNPLTAPSKRIILIAPYYDKVADGTTILEIIGLPKIREECQHFNGWVTKLEELGIQ